MSEINPEAAGDPVPAEALAASLRVVIEDDLDLIPVDVERILAAAAPLIVADRDATIHRQAVNIRNYRAEVGRLTAERDAAERDRDRFQALLKGSRARIEDVEAVVNRWRGFDMLAAEVRAALAGETPGGPR